MVLDTAEKDLSIPDGNIRFVNRFTNFLDCPLFHIRGDTTAFVVIAVSYAQHKFEFRL